ncbi:MAG: Delta-aminolevulinic acid dehydratase [bacterium ADurb.Bin236]|nr:MAG: Delta-aminolevulinic acid dehydratase [bacterium ADurb.Bin236]HOY61890.1 porphobilinogen synthase [bacterium]HPN95838.1 porphobilinogen synthase [bacterium]
MEFPIVRMRRMRRTETLRRMTRETTLSVDDLIAPLFIIPGSGERREIASMPGQYQMTADAAAAECAELFVLGVPAVILFGLPDKKDPKGESGVKADGVVQKATTLIKKAAPDLCVITDVCLCEYTSHGHCGLLKGDNVDNDATLKQLSRMALSHAAAGADMVAPSDMMDGRVAAIRAALDESGFAMTPIMSYAAKYASAFYGPFRDAADSAPQFGDRRSYQMDPANRREALREIDLDEGEGADILMVKPALAYLDVIAAVRERSNLPLAAYSVSGEYSMILAAAERGMLDANRAMFESLTSIKRAGADMILTYFAKAVAEEFKRRNG